MVASASDRTTVEPPDRKAIAQLAVRTMATSTLHAASSTSAVTDPGADVSDAAPLAPSTETTNAIDAFTDPVDVYSCTLPAHSRIRVTLVSNGTGLLADAYLYAGTTTSIAAAQALAGTASDDPAETFVYDNDTASDQPLYIAVVASDGLGSYALSCDMYAIPSGVDDDITGAVPLSGSTTGALDAETDVDDLCSVQVDAGQRLTLDLTTDASLSATAFVYGPDSTTLDTDLPEWGTSGGKLVMDARGSAGGTYYIDVHALAGSGAYSLKTTVTSQPIGAWDDVAQAQTLSAATGSLASGLDATSDRNDVYAIDLVAGQRLTLDLSSLGADFDLYAYVPGTTSIASAQPLVWASGSADQERLAVDATTTGRYYIEVRQFAGAGSYALGWAVTGTPKVSLATRVAGQNRYDTAIALSKSTFTHADTVVLATGEGFADALAASSLAGVYGSPVLLTPKVALPDGLLAELSRLGATRVVLVGGTGAVSTEVSTALKNTGLTVDRVFGQDRYATAVTVAQRVVAAQGADWNGEAIVVRGDQFADALAAAPVAYAHKMPILLTSSAVLSPATRDAIGVQGMNHILVVGGSTAISPTVYRALKAIVAPQGDVERAQGADRYATARAVADYTVRMYWADPSYVGVATGLDFPDALGGGAVAGAHDGVLLLTDGRSLSIAAAGFLAAQRSGLSQVRLFGGNKVVSDDVLTGLQTLTKP